MLACTLIKCLAFKNNSIDWAHIRQSIKAHKPNHQNKHLAHLSLNIIQPQWPSSYHHKAHQYSPPASMLLFLMIIDWGWRGDERGKPPACRIPGQRGTRPCDVENHLLSPHLHSLQPHLHGTSSAELCLPAQPFPHGFPTALGHSNTNESAIFNSLENLTTAAGFCYHFISIYWMEEKIAQFWIWEGERESRCTCEIGCSTLAYFMAGSTFNGLVCSFEEYLQRVFTNTWTISICTELGRPGIVSEVKNSFILTVRI